MSFFIYWFYYGKHECENAESKLAVVNCKLYK